MLNRLVELALTKRLLVVILTLLLAGAGLYAFRQLPIDAFPDVSSTQVKIIVKVPGMTPEEVESRIVMPIEQEMLGIPHQRILRAVAKYAIADITIDFDDGTDIYWARQQVSERFNGISASLPSEASGGLAPITTPLGEILMFTLDGPASLEEKRSVLDWVIRPQLRTIHGVADVNSLGGMARTFEVMPDPAALNARGLTIDDLRQTLESNNRNHGLGRVNEGEEALVVRAEGAMRNEADIAATVIASVNGSPVRIGDVAQVQIGALTRYGAVTDSGQGETVEGLVLGLKGANAQQVVREVKQRLEELQPHLPDTMKIRVFYDRGSLVERAVSTVAHALFEAIVLVVILLLAFLGNLRAALVVALTLPLSALATFILMRWAGLSANLMSLGGLAIAIGMLVDAAVVVVENIEAELTRPPLHVDATKLQRIFRAVCEVTSPVTSGIAIIVIVFLPLLTLEGLEGKLFIPVALSIVFALASSLLLAITIIPVLASWLLPEGEAHEPRLMQWLNARYEPVLRYALAHDKVLMRWALALLLCAGVAYTFVGKTFMPTMDEGDLIIQLEKLPSISLNATIEQDLLVQKAVLANVPEVERIVARVGSDELGLDPMGFNDTDTFLVLKPIEQWRNPDKEWLTDQLRKVMENFPGIGFTFTQPIDMRVSEMLTGVRGDVAIKVFGPDLATLNELSHKIESTVSKVPGAEDVFTRKNEGVQYLRIVIDRLACGRLGVSVDSVGTTLRSLIEGQPTGLIVEPTRRTPVLLRASEHWRDDINRLQDFRVPLASGGTVPLSAVARITRDDGPVKVDRENAQRYVVIQSNVRDRDLVGFVDDAKAAVAAAAPLPNGYRIEWGGQFENQQRAAQRLMLVIPVALSLIFFLLYSTFDSVRQAALVLANVPFALVGGVFALLLTGEYLSVPASVGFIALLGIAVLNGVVMVSYFNQLLADGATLAQAVEEGAKRRLRPVLMTASITAFGLVPLLFASGPGSEIQRPLAIVVVGGLFTSTALTLALLPALFKRFAGISTAA